MIQTWAHGSGGRLLDEPRVKVGRHTYGVGRRTAFLARDEDRVTVGNFCSVAEGVRFIFGEHRMDLVTTFPLRTVLCENWKKNVDAVSQGPIVIGNDVWIATNAVVLSGVTIGDGAVVAAGAIVTRDVPPYTIMAGVPARPVRRRCTEEQIAALLKIRWWDWPDEKILANVPLLSGDVDAFIEKFGTAQL